MCEPEAHGELYSEGQWLDVTHCQGCWCVVNQCLITLISGQGSACPAKTLSLGLCSENASCPKKRTGGGWPSCLIQSVRKRSPGSSCFSRVQVCLIAAVDSSGKAGLNAGTCAAL